MVLLKYMGILKIIKSMEKVIKNGKDMLSKTKILF